MFRDTSCSHEDKEKPRQVKGKLEAFYNILSSIVALFRSAETALISQPTTMRRVPEVVYPV